MKEYKALRPAHINNTHLNVGDTIALHPRAAQFLLADGTLEEITKKRRGGAPVPAQRGAPVPAQTTKPKGV